jgi:hypothetical protein
MRFLRRRGRIADVLFEEIADCLEHRSSFGVSATRRTATAILRPGSRRRCDDNAGSKPARAAMAEPGRGRAREEDPR